MPKMGEGYLPLLYIPDGAGRYIKCPVLTTTQRDALTAVKGMSIFNSTTGTFQVYDGSSWAEPGATAVAAHAADLDAHTYNPFTRMVIGKYYSHTIHSTVTTYAIVHDILYASPIFIARDITIDRIAIQVATAEAAKSVRVGIYNDSGSLTPSSLLLDCGEVSGATTGVKAITINQALTKGIYWVAQISDSDVIKLTQLSEYKGGYTILGIIAAALGSVNTVWLKAQAYGALPDPFTVGGTSQQYRGVYAPIRIASLD